MEKALGHLFITSSSSHFFNKTDFELHFFKKDIWAMGNNGPADGTAVKNRTQTRKGEATIC